MPAEAYPSPRSARLRVSGNPGASILGGGRVERRVGHVRQRPAHPLPRLQRHLPEQGTGAPERQPRGGAGGRRGGRRRRPATSSPRPCWPTRSSAGSATPPASASTASITSPTGRSRRRSRPAKLMKLDVTKLTHTVGHRRGVQRRPAADAQRRAERCGRGARSPTPPATACSPPRSRPTGMTGPAPIFEGDLGFFQLVTREPFDPAPFGGEFGNADGFMINKTYIKFWPAEYHSQSAIDAALQLRAELERRRVAGDGDRHRHVRGELQHHRQVPGGVGAEDPRDGRPQPAVLHRRGAARRRRVPAKRSTRRTSPTRRCVDVHRRR